MCILIKGTACTHVSQTAGNSTDALQAAKHKPVQQADLLLSCQANPLAKYHLLLKYNIDRV